MPYVLLFFGVVLLVAGIRNTYGQLLTLIENDVSGGFLAWLAAVAVVGGLGYIPKLKALSVAFMTLLLLVLVLSNGGVFAKLQGFLQSGSLGGASPGPTVTPTQTGPLAPLSPLAQINANLGAVASGQ